MDSNEVRHPPDARERRPAPARVAAVPPARERRRCVRRRRGGRACVPATHRRPPASAGSPAAAPGLPPALPAPPLPQQYYARGGPSAGPGMPGEFRRSLSGVAVGPRDAVYALGDDEVRVFDAGGRVRAQLEGAGEGVVPRRGGGWPRRRRLAGPRRPVRRHAAPTSAASRSAHARQARRRDARSGCVRRLGPRRRRRRAGHPPLRPARNASRASSARRTRPAASCCRTGASISTSMRAGVVHATDTGRHQVTSWTLDGAPVGAFGKFGMARPEDFVGCCNPVNVAVAPDGGIVTAREDGRAREGLRARTARCWRSSAPNTSTRCARTSTSRSTPPGGSSRRIPCAARLPSLDGHERNEHTPPVHRDDLPRRRRDGARRRSRRCWRGAPRRTRSSRSIRSSAPPATCAARRAC